MEHENETMNKLVKFSGALTSAIGIIDKEIVDYCIIENCDKQLEAIVDAVIALGDILRAAFSRKL